MTLWMCQNLATWHEIVDQHLIDPQLEAIALRLEEAITLRLEAIALRLEAIALRAMGYLHPALPLVHSSSFLPERLPCSGHPLGGDDV